ncbi:thioredoxin [Paucilactobacillus sp. N302-9]
MAQVATSENFQELTTAPIVIVDFWAPWCAPCKMVEPVLDQLEQEYHEIKFVKFNVDEDQNLAMKYKVMSIPSLVVFKDGTATEKVTGVYPKAKLAHYFEKKISETKKES